MKTPIELENVDLPMESIAALEKEITGIGIDGTLRIGSIRARPEMVYFLWHASGEVPVSMTALRSELEAPDVHRVIDSFRSKWQRRLQ